MPETTTNDNRYVALLLIVLATIAIAWTSREGHTPISDEGAYITMLSHFVQTGEVDFMKWCQPTYVGTLPIAAPWAIVFGTGGVSMTWLSIMFTVSLVAGLFLFLVRFTDILTAVLLVCGLFCFPDFIPCSHTFMTDVPYAAYLVWFLLVHVTLDQRSSNGQSGSGLMWATWCILLMLAVMTRPFAAIVIVAFGVAWLAADPERRAFHLRCTTAAFAMTVIGLLIVEGISTNRLTPLETTVFREVFVDHDYHRFNLRALCVNTLQLAALTVPFLVMTRSFREDCTMPRWLGMGVAFVGIALTLYFVRRELLPPIILPPGTDTFDHHMTSLHGGLAAAGIVFTARWLWVAVIQSRAATCILLGILIVTPIVTLPIMQHPLPRHTMPAFIAVTMLIAVSGLRVQTSGLAVWLLLLLFIGLTNYGKASLESQQNEHMYWMAEDLRRRDTPLADINGGWSWFCARYLEPGPQPEDGYVARYQRLVREADWQVVTELPDGVEPDQHETAETLGRKRHAYRFRRTTSPEREVIE